MNSNNKLNCIHAQNPFHKDLKVGHVAAGRNFSLVCTDDNQLYMWGRIDGEARSAFIEIASPILISYFCHLDLQDQRQQQQHDASSSYKYTAKRKKIISLGCADNYAIICADDGTVYSIHVVEEALVGLRGTTNNNEAKEGAENAEFQQQLAAANTNTQEEIPSNSKDEVVVLHSDGVNALVLRRVWSFHDTVYDDRIVSVHCGPSSYIIITENGAALYFRRPFREGVGQFSKTTTLTSSSSSSSLSSSSSSLLESDMPIAYSIEGHRIIQASCAQSYCAFLTDSGSIYTMGRGYFWQLGHHDTTCGECSAPHKISICEGSQGKRFTRVLCAERFVLALTVEGGVYQWGQISARRPPVKEPRLVESIKEKVVQIGVGSRYAIAITKSGSLLVWGENCDIIPFSSVHNALEPKEKDWTDLASPIDKIACGANHLIIVTKEEKHEKQKEDSMSNHTLLRKTQVRLDLLSTELKQKEEEVERLLQENKQLKQNELELSEQVNDLTFQIQSLWKEMNDIAAFNDKHNSLSQALQAKLNSKDMEIEALRKQLAAVAAAPLATAEATTTVTTTTTNLTSPLFTRQQQQQQQQQQQHRHEPNNSYGMMLSEKWVIEEETDDDEAYLSPEEEEAGSSDETRRQHAAMATTDIFEKILQHQQQQQQE